MHVTLDGRTAGQVGQQEGRRGGRALCRGRGWAGEGRWRKRRGADGQAGAAHTQG